MALLPRHAFCYAGATSGRDGAPASSPSTGRTPSAAASRVPLVDALAACASQDTVASFHFPGHRRGAAAPPALARLLGLPPFAHDLPELPELDNLFAPHDAIAQAQSRAAALFGADSTFFLVNGSTCGVQAAIMSTCPPGHTLILSRNCHISAFSEEAFAEAERQGEHLKIGALLITSPTYFGVCSDIRGIADACHKHNVPLIVDEAHGAHFRFHEELPATALQQGADIVIQSTHKTLQSSSPSYLLLASLDAATEHAAENGTAAFTDAIRLAKQARELLEQVEGLKVLSFNGLRDRGLRGVEAMDPLRITLGLWELGISGFEADDILRHDHQVIAELPLLQSITFAVSLGTTLEDVDSLVAAFKVLAKSRRLGLCSDANKRERSLASVFCTDKWRNRRLAPREAYFAASERVHSEAACDRVCCELICPYPPGIPVLVPGERISKEAVNYLKAVVKHGGFISGASDESVDTFLVCKQDSLKHLGVGDGLCFKY
ncbi:hypothetical protein GOP47_0011104 [Adiantum capillus-veneris]|uniref:Arginine decarboxylase n=1 Tax=Adiantum capillus-veneris TaxID=13818 RepID=A0A9D4ZHI9_ADICA|nr:hypothetical protein GOP47_0011104 [Adiantum capillus-veneris]